MITLRLLDFRSGTVLESCPRRFKSLNTAYNVLRRMISWKRGSLRMDDREDSGPKGHIQAQALKDGVVCMTWVWLEMRTIESAHGPRGVIPGSDACTQRRMQWVGVGPELATDLGLWKEQP